MQKDYFEAQNKALNSLVRLSIKLGACPDGINVANALLSVEKAVKDLSSLQDQAKQMGYKSASMALKALSQFKDTPNTNP